MHSFLAILLFAIVAAAVLFLPPRSLSYAIGLGAALTLLAILGYQIRRHYSTQPVIGASCIGFGVVGLLWACGQLPIPADPLPGLVGAFLILVGFWLTNTQTET